MQPQIGFQRVPELEIDKDAPFESDALNRKMCAEHLTRFLIGSPGGFAMSISAPWGGGKTFFIKRWQVLLESEGFSTALLNTWEDDYVEQPLVAIIDALDRTIAPRHDSTMEAVKEAGRKVLRIAGRFAVRKIAGDALTDAIKDETVATRTVVDDLLQAQQELRNAVQTFRKRLEEFAASVAQGKYPLVILVDELDRARPSYAIDFLECVKHFCEVSGIVFVFAMDREQILRTVDKMFGCGDCSDSYLRRFIDYNFRLPEPSLEAYCDSLVHRCHLPTDDKNLYGEYSSDVWQTFLPMIARAFGFGLRQIGQYALRLSVIAQMSGRGRWFFYSNSILLLCALNETDSRTYSGIVTGAGHEPITTVVDWAKNHPRPDLLRQELLSNFFGQLFGLVIGEKVSDMSTTIHTIFDRGAFNKGFASVKEHRDYARSDAQNRAYLRSFIELTSDAEA